MHDDETQRRYVDLMTQDQPPLTLDATTVLERGRRSRRAWLASTAGGALAGVAALAVGVAFALPGPASAPTMVAGAPRTPAPPTVASAPASRVDYCKPGSEGKVQLTERQRKLTCQITTALLDLDPNWKIAPVGYGPKDAQGLESVAWQLSERLHYVGVQEPMGPWVPDTGEAALQLRSDAVLTDERGGGRLSVAVDKVSAGWSECEIVLVSMRCDEVSGPAGERMFVVTWTDELKPGETIRSALVIVQSAGTQVAAAANNMAAGSVAPDHPTVLRGEPVLTIDQLKAIALDPDLRLYG